MKESNQRSPGYEPEWNTDSTRYAFRLYNQSFHGDEFACFTMKRYHIQKVPQEGFEPPTTVL